jgi:hypothetical protein
MYGFDVPYAFQFISRRSTLLASENCFITLYSDKIKVKFQPQTPNYEALSVVIPCTAQEWQVSSLEQVCTSSLPPVSTSEGLYILQWLGHSRRPYWQDDVENTQWLDLLRSVVAVKNIYLSDEFVPRIAPALQELVGGKTAEVLPILKNIFLKGFQPSGPVQEGIESLLPHDGSLVTL